VIGVAIADLLVGWVWVFATGVTTGDILDATKLRVSGVKAPKATASEHEFSHSYLNFQLSIVIPNWSHKSGR
jgi:hypothetical protein